MAAIVEKMNSILANKRIVSLTRAGSLRRLSALVCKSSREVTRLRKEDRARTVDLSTGGRFDRRAQT